MNEKKIAGCGGKTAVVLPMSSPRRVEAFNGDLLDRKSKSSLFPGAGGGGAWLQMTSA